jgi:peptide/nickel transport system substrate-binding protein
MRSRWSCACSMRGRLVVAILAVLVAGVSAAAQESPRRGGELIFLVPAEPPSYDAHREETFAVVHPAAPHYNTLLRVDPADRDGHADRRRPRPIVDGRGGRSDLHGPDPPRRPLPRRQRADRARRQGELRQDHLPPARGDLESQGRVHRGRDGHRARSLHRGLSPEVALRLVSVLARVPLQLDLQGGHPGPGHPLVREERDGNRGVPLRRVREGLALGRPAEPRLLGQGQTVLDGYRALFVRESAAQVAAIRGQRARIQFRGFSPPERDSLVQALGNAVTVQESPWECSNPLAVNHERKPFDDPRVRRALSLALDRHQGAASLSRLTILREVAGVLGVGTPLATPRADLERLAGYSRDIAKSRAEARRLLREAGVPEGFAFTFKNRGIPNPYDALGVWLVDQWRQIGLNVRIETLELGMLYRAIFSGDFEVAADFHCSYIVEPDLALFKFQSMDVSPINYSRYVDRTLDELYQKQSRAADREERRHSIREFERRLLDDEAHYIYTFQWHRIVVHSARVRGWTITPSHFLNNQLDTVWLAEP